MKIHAIITARKGSKRFKKKNIYNFKNQALFLWSVNSALKSNFINKTVVSTDDKKIIDICKSKNIDFVQRPKELSSDKSSSFSVLKHYYKSCDQNEKPDYLIILQPTSPLREKNLINSCLKKIISTKADRLIELCELKLFYGFVENNLWRSKFKEHTRSQDLKPIYVPSGRIWIYKTNTTIKKNSSTGKKTIPVFEKYSNNINIDYEEDLIKLNQVFNNNKHKYSYLISK